MSLIHGLSPTISNDLILAFDATNARSYPPPFTSETWFNLNSTRSAPKGCDATLHGAAYSTGANGGYFALNGVDNYISAKNPALSPEIAEGDLTFEYWLEPTAEINSLLTESATGTDYFTAQNLNSADYKYSDSAYASLIFAFGTNGFVAGAYNDGYAPPILVDYQPYSGLNQLVVIKTPHECSYYINGVFKKSSLSVTPVVLGVEPTLITTNRAELGAFYKGNIYSYRLYGKALTETEIQQNFDIINSRL